MKKNLKMFLTAIVILTAFILTSCGSKQLSKIALNENLDDIAFVYPFDEKDFFEPTQGIYSLMEKDGKLEITLEFVKKKKNQRKKYSVEKFSMMPVDGDGRSILIDGDDVEFQALDRQKKADELLNAAVGDKVKVTFTYLPKDKESKSKIVENFVKCSVELEMEEIEKSLKLPQRGEVVTGSVVLVKDEYVVVNLGCKKDGMLPAEEVGLEEGQTLCEMFKEGDEVQAKVIKTDDADDNFESYVEV